MSKRVLITGAGGYIGRHVVKDALDSNLDVTACDFKQGDIDKRAKFVSTDIFSGNKDIFKQLGSPDVCLHMAWLDGFNHNSQSHLMNLSKHYEFVYNMIQGGLPQLAVMGTMHEIGYHEGVIDENTSCNPTSMYGIAKDALRRSTLLLTQENNVVLQWIRAYYIYGDDVKNNSIFSKLIQAENEGKATFPFTTGKNKFDFTSVDELAGQIVAVINQDSIAGIINCCTGKPVSLADKVEQFIKEHNFKIRLEYGAYPDRPYDSPCVWGDNTKIQDILNRK